MKEKNPFNEEYELRAMLDSYKVEIPDFPRQRSSFDRVIHFLASPAKNPFERLEFGWKGMVTPLLIAVVLGIIQSFIL